MKKTAFAILAMVLLMSLVCGSAFALTGDLTIKSAKMYSDPELKNCVGTIPKYTSVLVRAYGSYADVVYNGVKCYVKPSTLTQGKYDYNYIGVATLKKGATIYQRPSSSSRQVKNSRSRSVKVYVISEGYALVRSSKGVFGFVKADSLTGLKY